MNAGVPSRHGVIVHVCQGCGTRYRSLADQRLFPYSFILLALVVAAFFELPDWAAIAVSGLCTWEFVSWAYSLRKVSE